MTTKNTTTTAMTSAPPIEAVKRALLNYKAQHNHATMRTLLEKVAGVSSMSEIPPDKYADVIKATKLTPEEVAKLGSVAGRWAALRVATMHGHARVYGRKAPP